MQTLGDATLLLRSLINTISLSNMECSSCFTIAEYRGAVLCNGENPHFFCRDCFNSYIDSKIGTIDGNIICIHTDGCSAVINDHWIAVSAGEEKANLVSK